MGVIVFAAATDRATPGLERSMVGEWVLRNGLGETGRANSATAHGDAGMPVGEALDRVEAWFVERDRRPLLQVFDETPRPVVDELDQRGYAAGPPTEVMSAPVEALHARLTIREALEVELADEMPTFLRDQLAPPRTAEMLSTALPTRFAAASLDGSVVGAGMAVLDGDLVGIFAMRSAPDRQGLGAGTAVIAGLLDAGAAAGAATAWLQVEASNERAVGWYRRLGFERRTGYRYRGPSSRRVHPLFTQSALTQ